MAEIDFIAEYSDLQTKLFFIDKPVYAVRYVPEKTEYKPMYLKLPTRRWNCSKNVSFTRDVGDDINGVRIALFKDKDVATTAIIKLSLIGKSRRRNVGEYEVQELGNINYNARFSVSRRVPEKWAEQGVTLDILHERTSEDFNDAKRYGYNYGEKEHPTEVFIEMARYGYYNGNYESKIYTVFDMAKIYQIIYNPRYAWNNNYSDYYAMSERFWEWPFLTDLYKLNEMAVNEDRVVKGPLAPLEHELHLYDRGHKQFGIDFSGVDYDPFLEYVITREEDATEGIN